MRRRIQRRIAKPFVFAFALAIVVLALLAALGFTH